MSDTARNENGNSVVSRFQLAQKPIFLLGVIFLFALILRIYHLGTESYWIDEIATVFEARQSLVDLLNSGRLDQPIGYYIPFRLWMQVFGPNQFATRLFSVLAGVGVVILVFYIGREMFGTNVGAVSAFLMSISTFQLHYSQETRNYMLFELLVVISYLLFILALKKKQKFLFVGYLLASIWMVYSNSFGLFVLVAQGLYFVFQIRKYRKLVLPWAVCQIIMLIAIVPYHYSLMFGSGGPDEAISMNIRGLQTPSLSAPLRTMYRFILPARLARSWNQVAIVYGAAGIVLIVGLWIHARRSGLGKLTSSIKNVFLELYAIPHWRENLLLIGLWFLCTLALPFVYSMFVTPIYKDNYVISAAPALTLFVGLGIFLIRKAIPVWLSIMMLVIIYIPGLHQYYSVDQKEAWDEAAQYIASYAQNDDLIIFAPNWGNIVQQRSFDWYYDGEYQVCTIGDQYGYLEAEKIPDAFKKCYLGYKDFWVIVSDQNVVFDNYAVFFDSPPSSVHLKSERQFTGGISVYRFEAAE